MVKEWGDSIVFALIAASMIRGYVLEAFTIPTPSMEKELLVGDFLFVNKLSYGTRVPFTPISFPLAHNTIPFTYANSYSTAIKLPYYRLPGFGKVKRNDIVVFNYPTGDTAVFGRIPGEVGAGGELQGHNYYQFIAMEAWYIATEEENKTEKYFLNNRGYYEGKARTRILKENWKHHWDNTNRRWVKVDLSGHSYRPIDKRENYIKRCVAIGGETLEIVNGKLMIDGVYSKVGNYVNFLHEVHFNRNPLKSELVKFKDNYGFNLEQYNDVRIRKDAQGNPTSNSAVINMSEDVKVQFISDIKSGKYADLRFYNDTLLPMKILSDKNLSYVGRRESYQNIYPNHPKFPWTVDNYGPLWMPKEGASIELTDDNWIKYKRCITVYEGNESVIKKADGVYINGQKVTDYTFKQNYYFMVGDNRHKSADSRMWGFVPEDHVVGKGLFVWMSKDLERGWFSGGVRWGRIFKTF
jgi:signal peptidase I